MNTKTVLVTGSSGLVGCAIKNVSENFNYKFIFITSKDCNLEDSEETNKYFNFLNPHYVIHLAACVGGLYKNMNQKVDMLEKNILINFNVIKACYSSKVEKLICVLSTCIFPDKTSYPINETMLHDGPPHDSNYAYAYAKRMMEIHCRVYNEQYNTNYSCIIPTNIYGPYDNFSLTDGHVIPALIHKCYNAKKNNEPFEILGTGKPLRQFIYSDDLAICILKLINIINKENIIISNNIEYSIRDIAITIAEKYDYTENIIFNSNYSDGQYKKTADSTKMKQLLYDFKFTDIKNGIENSINYFINNYENARK